MGLATILGFVATSASQALVAGTYGLAVAVGRVAAIHFDVAACPTDVAACPTRETAGR